MAKLKPADFADADGFVVLGAEPFRVDLIMGPPGAEFESAWRNRVALVLNGTTINYVSKDDLIALKEAAGRPVDRRDIAALRAPGATKPKKP